MPVYELIVNLSIFAVLWWGLRKRRWPEGMLFLVYLTLYSLERLLLAFTSSYKIIGLGMTQSQMVALVGLAVAIPLMIWPKKRSVQEPVLKQRL